MARSYRGGGRSSGGRSSGGNRSRSSGPKGQIRQGKAVQYSVEGSSGETKYIGTTNNPRHRVAEHRQSGKMQKGDKLRVETKPVPRKTAEGIEARKLAGHRNQHGRNPRHNKTNDGRYHP